MLTAFLTILFSLAAGMRGRFEGFYAVELEYRLPFKWK